MTFGGLTGGIISDIIGRRQTFLFSILLFSSMSVLNGLTNNLTVFMISRALTGFGIFCMMVVSIAYIAEMTPGESRGDGKVLRLPAVSVQCQSLDLFPGPLFLQAQKLGGLSSIVR